jgi:hypothetical protein
MPVAWNPPLRTGGFFFCYCRARQALLTVPFKSMLLGSADAPDEASLAAHRCSDLRGSPSANLHSRDAATVAVAHDQAPRRLEARRTIRRAFLPDEKP